MTRKRFIKILGRFWENDWSSPEERDQYYDELVREFGKLLALKKELNKK